MLGQSCATSSSGGFRSAILKLSKAVDGICCSDSSTVRYNSMLQGRAKILGVVVSKVGEALMSLLEKFPKMEVAACNMLLFGSAVIAIADLFLDLVVIKVQKVITSSRISQTQTFAKETFLYVKPRLERLYSHDGQDLGQTDHHCSADMNSCIGRLDEVTSVVESCISKLGRSSRVTATLSVIFGVAGIAGRLFAGFGWSFVIVGCTFWIVLYRVSANYVNLKTYFITYQETCEEIKRDLSEAKKKIIDNK